MKVHITNRQKDLPLKSKQVRSLVKAFLAFEEKKVDEVGIHFVTEAEICQLHQQFFNDSSPTDCISFPIENTLLSIAGSHSLGDVFVCPKTALIYAEGHQSNPYEEVALYIVHGLLHLIGYDDMESKQKRKMRAAEKRHLLNLNSLHIVLD